MGHARDVDGAARLAVCVKPRSAKEVVAVIDGVVVVRVAAPPAEGRANARVVELMAAHLGVPRARVTLVRGAAARHKELAIAGLLAASVDEALAKG
jgi:uncharacterized protein (TIGR00251 family)